MIEKIHLFNWDSFRNNKIAIRSPTDDEFVIIQFSLLKCGFTNVSPEKSNKKGMESFSEITPRKLLIVNNSFNCHLPMSGYIPWDFWIMNAKDLIRFFNSHGYIHDVEVSSREGEWN